MVLQFDRINHPLVQQVYNNQNNYLIQYDNNSSTSACIYFTSNGLYYPNTMEEFKKKIIDENRFEWYKNKLTNIKKHIFIRDVFKQWYIGGVNAKLDTIEKTLEFLKQETFGYDITTIGSSAGGFAAVLFGCLLQANKIITINGQFNLSFLLFGDWNRIDNPILVKYENNEKYSKYYNLVPFIKNYSKKIIYFTSTCSNLDVMQLKFVEKCSNCLIFKIYTDIHGIPFWLENMNMVLNTSYEKYIKIESRNTLYPVLFSVKISGINKTIIILIKRIIYNFAVFRNHTYLSIMKIIKNVNLLC